ncbi:hypothetical protein EDC04DRAFT_2599622 [Pisolithus marmoratus]|nr:hypothetical protein EDC04DRAFT_2599622 [Pisolithus marmoratus]
MCLVGKLGFLFTSNGYGMMNSLKAKMTNLTPRIFMHEFKRVCGDPKISAACLLVSLLGLGSNTSQVVALHMQIYKPSFASSEESMNMHALCWLDKDINAIVNMRISLHGPDVGECMGAIPVEET